MYKKLAVLLLLVTMALTACNPNKPPVVNFSSDKSHVYAHIEEVRFTFSASDPENMPLSCVLSFGDGVTSVPVSCSMGVKKHTYDLPGSYTATFEATDEKGASISSSAVITVEDNSHACYSAVATSVATSSVRLQGVHEPAGAAFVPGQILVLPKDRGGLKLDLANKHLSVSLRLIKAIKAPLGLDGPAWLLYQTTAGEEMKAARELVASGAARYAQPNFIYKTLALAVPPNDTLYGQNQRSQFELVGLETAWARALSPTNDSLDPLVAVIDSGIAYDHVDLQASVDNLGRDFSSESGADGYPTPSSGLHGTMVGSIIAAQTDNNEGIAGVTYNMAKLVPYKIFPGGTSVSIKQAINRAIADGANVINLSLCITTGSGQNVRCANLYDNPDLIIERALQDAHQAGLVAVAASGNYSDEWVGYPASSKYTIAVGSVDQSGSVSDFSNGGARLDLTAPGENMVGAGFPIINDGGQPKYMVGDGTSFSSPMVAGVAALYMRQYKALRGAMPSPTQVAKCLCATAEDRGPVGVDDDYGAGIVRADRVMDTSNHACYP